MKKNSEIFLSIEEFQDKQIQKCLLKVEAQLSSQALDEAVSELNILFNIFEQEKWSFSPQQKARIFLIEKQCENINEESSSEDPLSAYFRKQDLLIMTQKLDGVFEEDDISETTDTRQSSKFREVIDLLRSETKSIQAKKSAIQAALNNILE